MDKIKRIKELIKILCAAAVAYYRDDEPVISDKQYDDLYDELELLEKETGCIMASSPTQKVQGYIIDSLAKVQHTRQMLSANKTKDINEVRKFIANKTCVLSWKEDGLTIVLRYKNGILDKAITRGSEGMIGEDVTHTMKLCATVPLSIPYCADIQVRGECVISWDDFAALNQSADTGYKHPRNLAAGTVRQLDSNFAKDRNIIFKAFELVQDDLYEESKANPNLLEQIMSIEESFQYMEECGFDVVEHEMVISENLESVIQKFNPKNYYLPVDGLIFTYNDYLYGKSLGETSHHPLNMIALKWADDLYETKLTDIEWQTSRTGLINPVAVFEPVDLGGAITTKATLHNISYIEDLQLGIGDSIQVYRANMVIPKVHNNLTRSNTWQLPDKCPTCGSIVEVHNDNGSKTLHCCNDSCRAKLLGKLAHAVSRNALNIDGLSEATLEKFIGLGWITSIFDIYHLDKYFDRIIQLDGFGKKSTLKLLESIKNSRGTTLDRFIYSLSIPLIGKSASKDIAKVCNYSFNSFVMVVSLEAEYAFMGLDGFGNTMNESLRLWWNHNNNEVFELSKEFHFLIPESKTENVDLTGKTFVITGSLSHFSNRDEAKERIEALGGKVSGSVSVKTTYLVNNDLNSTSGKNQKAKSLSVPIINEEELLRILKGSQEE